MKNRPRFNVERMPRAAHVIETETSFAAVKSHDEDLSGVSLGDREIRYENIYFAYTMTSRTPVAESMSLNHDDYGIGLYCSEVGSFRFRDFRL